MVALALSCVLLGVYVLFIWTSYGNQGTLSVYYGSAGVFALLVCLVALVLALQSLGEENSFRLFPRAAFFVSLLALAGWGGTYALGFLH